MVPRVVNRLSLLLFGVALLAVAALAPVAQAKPKPKTVNVQLISINDLEGAVIPNPGRDTIAPAPGQPRVTVGGALSMGTHIDRLRAENPKSIVLSAGADYNNRTFFSSVFADDPTIEALNLMGFQMGAVSNHELNDGLDEFRRLSTGGGCAPPDPPLVDVCPDEVPFDGADFPRVAANILDRDTGEPFVRPFVVKRVGGVRIGFIGITLEETPSKLTDPTVVDDLEFVDEAGAINRYTRVLKRRGIETIVVFGDIGGFTDPGGISECNGGLRSGTNPHQGDIVDIIARANNDVDAWINGDTQSPYVCVVEGAPVVQGTNHSQLIGSMTLEINRKSGEVVGFDARNIINDRAVPEDPAIRAMVDTYMPFYTPVANRVIGRLTATASNTFDASGESQAGGLLADSYQAAGDLAVAGFPNPGGIRSSYPGGDLTFLQTFTVTPFSNHVYTGTFTGNQLYTTLKQQWCGQPERRVLQVSESVSYTWDESVAASILGQDCAGAANPVSDLTINSVPVDPAQSYRIAINSFLRWGGDNFSTLMKGTNYVPGPWDIQAVAQYMEPTLTGSPLAPPTLDRINVVP